MKAIVIDAYGSSSELKIREVERPRPGAGEVLIRVHAAGINPADWKLRKGTFRMFVRLKLPVVLGLEVSGVVEDVGPGVRHIHPGDEVVAGLSMKDGKGPGGYAEYAIAKAGNVARKPEGLSFEEAGAIPVAAVTALQALELQPKVAQGGSVLINGASGGVGIAAVQIAKTLGAGRVVGVCGPKNVDFVRSLGADEVIDYTREDFSRRPDIFDVVFDAVGNTSFGPCRGILGATGVFVSIAPSPASLTWTGLVGAANALGYPKRAKAMFAEVTTADLERVLGWAKEGRLKTVLAQVFPLAEAQSAHEASESGRTRGKLVLKVA